MHKLNYFLSVLLVILMSLVIVFCSSALVLRMSTTYLFHFNDSEVMYDIPYSVKGSDMAGEITSYFMSFKDEPFQVYEDNRIFKDPIIEKEDQQVMKKVKRIINIELLAAIVSLAGFLGIYFYLYRKNFKEALRNRIKVGIGITVLLLTARVVAVCLKPCRVWAYNKFIGVKLPEFSIIGTILGDPFYQTYIIFATLAAVILTGIILFIHYKLTKPERIFY